jgi:putative SOS response-associated peptidase YedK
MIDRYSIHATREQLIERFQIDDPEAHKPRYNAAPSQLLPVITDESPQGVSYFYWGNAPRWIKNKAIAERIINTRAEAIRERPILKKMLRSHRCLVPATGFYIWKKVGKKTTIPWYYRLRTKQVFSFAGLWEEYDDAEGNYFHTFSIITAQPADELMDVTDRFPVILAKAQEATWLNKNSTEELLVALLLPPASSQLEGHSVSPAIHSTDIDKPGLIVPVPPADQFGNLTLFD